MAKFVVHIDTANDAFQPDRNPEVARLLREVADKLDAGVTTGGFLRDYNGNTVGGFAHGNVTVTET